MPTDERTELRRIRDFRSLIPFLRDRMGWPIEQDLLDDVEDLFFDFTAEELGVDPKNAAKIRSIKQLRPLNAKQPFGVFFVQFEPKRLPVVALRRILSHVVVRKRASANKADRVAWQADDLLFVSNYGEGDERQITFAHFSQADDKEDLPTLKVLGWDNRDTPLHLDTVAADLTGHLKWPADESDTDAWRQQWRKAFTLRHGEVIDTSRTLSIRLAELARGIRDRIKTALAIEADAGPLTKLMKAFQEALVHDLNADGFADMYAQTIAYGLLSARIADPIRKTADDFAGHLRTNPFLRDLMEAFLKVGGRKGRAGRGGIDFDELGVSDVVELLDAANMEAVVRDFGDKNPQEDPVIHFYELFLKEYDAQKRMQRGVFYTPRPVVSYIVRSVDSILRTEFGLEDGLADTATWRDMAARHENLKIPVGISPDQDFVHVLDPATGTGTFIVEVIDVIHKTLLAKWTARGEDANAIDALWNDYVPRHLLPRLHGYELLMAPYAIAHLKVGLKLYETGYRFGSDERARIYLTNALEPPTDDKAQMHFKELLPALAHEARAVNAVKKAHRFTVVIGNPPYSGVSSNRIEWIEELLKGVTPLGGHVANYYEVDGQPLGEKKVWLQDDYVKFTRFSHYLLEQTSLGIHGMITNHSYLDSPTCRGMRSQLVRFFSTIALVDLHGSTKRGESAPDGLQDENVFDILPGVAIMLAVSGGRNRERRILSIDKWGNRNAKFNWLLKHSYTDSEWRAPNPRPPYYLFVERQLDLQSEYLGFLSLKEIFPFYGTGVQTSRDHFATDIDRQALEKRLREFFDPNKSDRQAAEAFSVTDTRGWKIRQIRQSVTFQAVRKSIVPFMFRAFDRRWIALTKDIVDWPRLEVMSCVGAERIALVCSRQQAVAGFRHALVVDSPVDMFCLSNKSREGQTVFPLFSPAAGGLFASSKEPAQRVNLGSVFSRRIRALESAGKENGVEAKTQTLDMQAFAYVYSILFSPAYRARYADLLKMDFPRVPTPTTADLFRNLSRLGSELIALHLMRDPNVERSLPTYTGPADPEVVRVGWSRNTVWIDAPTPTKGSGRDTGTVGFRGVPEEVWNFQLGGYQVCEKWLKDRKGRTLSKDEISHYQKMVAAVSETIRLMAEIDEAIEKHGGWPEAFVVGPTLDSQCVEFESDELQVSNQQDLFATPDDKEPSEEEVADSTKRSIDDVGFDEVMGSIRQLFGDGGVREREAAIVDVARELGFNRTTSKIRESVDNGIRTAVRRGIIQNSGSGLRIQAKSVEDYDRDFLKEQFLASLQGRVWTDRDEAVRSFARWMGFKRTGPAINEIGRSLINGLIRTGRLEAGGSDIRRTGN